MENKKIKKHKSNYIRNTSIAIIATSIGIIAIVAIGAGVSKKPVVDVMLITDTGTVTDKSFNQQAWEATRDTGEALGFQYGYFEPGSSAISEQGLLDAYTYAIDEAEASTLVLPGFNHELPLLDFAPEHMDNRFIFIDDGGQSLASSALYPNVVSVKFVSQETGYLTGLISAAYVDVVYEGGITDSQSKTVGMWGGIPLNTVYDFMTGFAFGIHTYNMAKYEYSEIFDLPTYTKLNQDAGRGTDYVEVISPGLDGTNVNSWYSFSFGAGDGQANASSLVNNGAKVQFAVAGPQTNDAAIEVSRSDDPYDVVVGVDTNARVTNPDYADIMITSATKNVYGVTQAILEEAWNPDTNDFTNHFSSTDLTDNEFKAENYSYQVGDITYESGTLIETSPDPTTTFVVPSGQEDNYTPWQYWGYGEKTNIKFDLDGNGSADLLGGYRTSLPSGVGYALPSPEILATFDSYSDDWWYWDAVGISPIELSGLDETNLEQAIDNYIGTMDLVKLEILDALGMTIIPASNDNSSEWAEDLNLSGF